MKASLLQREEDGDEDGDEDGEDNNDLNFADFIQRADLQDSNQKRQKQAQSNLAASIYACKLM